MKKVIKTLKNAFFYTTAIFTAVICFFILVYLLIEGGDKGLNLAVPKCTLLFAGISGVCIAIVGAFSKIPAIFRYVIDFVLSYGALFVWFKMLSAGIETILPSHFFMFSTVYAVIFTVIACFAALMTKLSGENKKNEKNDGEYDEVFSETK